MKIAILVSMFPPRWLGGTELATYNMARELAQRHEVHVITTWDRGFPIKSKENGFHVHRIGTVRLPLVTPIYSLGLVPIVRKIRPDIIHAQSVWAGLPALLMKRIFRVPFVIWGQGSDVYLPDLLLKMTSKRVLKNADSVIALTNDMKERMQNLYLRDVFVIPNGIEFARFQGLTKEKARQKLMVRHDESIILFTGTLKSVKGLNYLIEAMSIIFRENPKARLVLIGDGPQRQNLERLARELNLAGQTSFIGRVSNESIPEYMAASDVFVLPSLSEGLPVVSLEAMASGLPIVATKIGGLPEIIKEGENGFLVEPRSPKEIAERVLFLLRDDELRRKISENNRHRAMAYDWRNIVDKIELVYREVLSSRVANT